MTELNKTMNPEEIVNKILVDGIFKAPQFVLADRLIENPSFRGNVKGLEVPFKGPQTPSPLLLGWMLEERDLEAVVNITELQLLSEQLIKQIGDFINGNDTMEAYDRERKWNKLNESGAYPATSEEIINPIYFQKRARSNPPSFCPTGNAFFTFLLYPFHKSQQRVQHLELEQHPVQAAL